MSVKSLNIEGSKVKPTISFENGKVTIEGRAIHYNAGDWFLPLFQALNSYSSNPNDITEININLDYVNSDSNRSLMNLIVLAEKIHSRGKNVIIRWYYKKNDMVMLDQGNVFKSLCEVPFKFETLNQ